jgi:hypothetical protein
MELLASLVLLITFECPILAFKSVNNNDNHDNVTLMLRPEPMLHHFLYVNVMLAFKTKFKTMMKVVIYYPI